MALPTGTTGPTGQTDGLADAARPAFAKGDLVYSRTDGGWFGEVVRLLGRVLVLRWFEGRSLYKVPSRNAVPIARFLQQQGRSWKLRRVYGNFFGEYPGRMPRRRLKSLQEVLRRHGVGFDASKTRADDFFPMWINPAHLAPADRARLIRSSPVDDATREMLPKWLVPVALPPSSRDPLGWQADALKLADGLLPGLTVFTSRVGYFFFLAWAVRELNRQDTLTTNQRQDVLERLERALVLCEAFYHGKDGLSECFHQGQRVKTRLLAKAANTAEIPDRILKNQRSTGCYNLYRTAMRSCGFWLSDDDMAIRGLLPYRLTKRGEKLANAFGRRECSNSLLRWAVAGTGYRRTTDLQDWGQELCFCRFQDERSEKRWFLDGFLFAPGDAADVVREADSRLRTLQSLAHERLLARRRSSQRPPADAATRSGVDGSADLEVQDAGENAMVLMHYYRHRHGSGAKPFVAAAVYELLALGLTAVWADLLNFVRDNGRTPIAKWSEVARHGTATPSFWRAALASAGGEVRTPEERLVDTIWSGKKLATTGLQLLLKVWARVENRAILHESLPTGALPGFIERVLDDHGALPTEQSLPGMATALLRRHADVSTHKGKERWLETDETDAWAIDPRPIALGFHSYRFPQLMSLLSDLRFTRDNLRE